MTLAEEGSIDDPGVASVGTLTVENRFVFREPVDVPPAHACVYAPERQLVPVDYRVDGTYGVSDSVAGRGSLHADVFVRLSRDQVAAVDEPIPIERTSECPPEAVDPRIVVVVGTDVVPRA